MIGTSIFVQFRGTLRRYQCSILFNFVKHCVTPRLTPFALNVYDVYIKFNRGVELKEKSPPSIWLFYVSMIEIIADGISCYPAPYSFGIM